MALLIKPDGSKQAVAPENGKNFTLEELQKYVGGYIEIIKLGTTSLARYYGAADIAVVNEEGRLKHLPYNSEATLLNGFNPLVGDVLFCFQREIE